MQGLRAVSDRGAIIESGTKLPWRKSSRLNKCDNRRQSVTHQILTQLESSPLTAAFQEQLYAFTSSMLTVNFILVRREMVVYNWFTTVAARN